MALFNFFSTQEYMGLEISKRYSSYHFHRNSAKFMRTLFIMWGCRQLLFLAISQIKKNVALWNLNIGDNAKILKRTISWMKTGDRCAKRMKIWEVRRKNMCMSGTFHVWFYQFSLGSFGSFRKISDIKIFRRPFLPQFPTHFNQTSWKVWQSVRNTD